MGVKVVANIEAKSVYQANEETFITLACYALLEDDLLAAVKEANFNLLEELKKKPEERSTEPFKQFAIADCTYQNFLARKAFYQVDR